MRFEIRIHIDGASFDPQAFAEGLPPEEAGDVRRYLGHRAAAAGRGWGFWMSKAIKVQESPEEASISLLESLGAYLETARAMGGDISLQVTAYYKAKDDHQGFYVPRGLVELLGKVGASLDYAPAIDLGAPSDG